jgi:hypothetical protein
MSEKRPDVATGSALLGMALAVVALLILVLA